MNLMNAINSNKTIEPTPIPVQQKKRIQNEISFDNQMRSYWKNQMGIVQAIDSKTEDFLGQILFDLHTDKIKYSGKILNVSPEVRVILSKACELFITDLTLHFWVNTEDGKRKLMITDDLKRSIYENDRFDFLMTICNKFLS